jgi:rubredoxin
LYYEQFVEDIKNNPPMEIKKYRCNLCGYVYDPAVGYPVKRIAPGTPFEELPEGWTCPVCGSGKEHFVIKD